MNPVQKALWFVESHSRDPITLEDIAKACNVSAFHLTRAFAATMGLSLMRYVRSRRLSEAARQLAQGADDILSVAIHVGYGSHEAFTRAFREQFALTPEQVRAQGHLNNISMTEAIVMNTTSITTSL
jgi:AraC family transcriptional regulator